MLNAFSRSVSNANGREMNGKQYVVYRTLWLGLALLRSLGSLPILDGASSVTLPPFLSNRHARAEMRTKITVGRGDVRTIRQLQFAALISVLLAQGLLCIDINNCGRGIDSPCCEPLLRIGV